MTEILAYGFSFESTQRELSNEYQLDTVCMVYKDFCILMLWMKVASAMEGLYKHECVINNPLILMVAKSSLTILVKSFSQKHI